MKITNYEPGNATRYRLASNDGVFYWFVSGDRVAVILPEPYTTPEKVRKSLPPSLTSPVGLEDCRVVAHYINEATLGDRLEYHPNFLKSDLPRFLNKS